jgi:hypothetical protein
VRRFPTLAVVAALSLAIAGCQRRTPQEHTAPDPPGGSRRLAAHDPSLVRVTPADGRELATFGTEKRLKTYIAESMARQRRRAGANVGYGGILGEVSAAPPSAPMDAAAGPGSSTTAKSEAQAGDDNAGRSDSITNTQVAGVDEGGIVKTHGDHLVVLRRGRLFSVRVGDAGGKVAPVSMVDVTPPGGSHDAWYDEMLISGDRIVVVGFSYQEGATELGLFDIDAAGRIRHRATHFLRSNDYYSSRNYASRLLGDKLVFYMPYSLASYDEAALTLPGVKKRGKRWETIVDATRIYRPLQDADSPVLHTVVTCDLAQPDMSCRAQGIVGPYGRTFYVSQTAVYVWVQSGYGREASSVVYRLPLADEAPGAMRVKGAPTDQFSFHEDPSGYLDVLVRAEQNGGDTMWAPEVSAGDVALLRVPVASFANRVGTAREKAYTALAKPARGYTMQNRFVGGHVLYGTGSGWGYAEDSDHRVYAYPVAGGRPFALKLAHGVDRIEQMGDAAVVIGTDGTDLHFTAVDLERETIADRYRQKGASQGELRSHGFFFKPTGEDEGVLGLPVRSGDSAGYQHLVEGSAKVLFLGVDHLKFKRLGALAARNETPDDQCQVSCVDWYGNARPIFYRGRIFALLGYELVEGHIDGERIRETGRTSFLMKHRLRAAR